jgi:cell division transport system permease protein
MFTTFKRIIKFGWQGFWREKETSASTIFILFITLTLISFLFSLKFFSQYLISLTEKKADVSIYFKEETSEDEILGLEEELKKLSEVKEVEYISKEKALEEFRQRHKENPVLMETLAEVGINPFLAALNIKAWGMADYEKIVNFLTNSPFKEAIAKIDYFERKGVIEKIFQTNANLEKTVLILSLIFGIISILVLFNTIRLAIFNQSQEIKIQRLVGASNWFIRGPFIVQGMISGIFAFFLSFSIFSLVLWFLSPKIENLAPGFNLWEIFQTQFWNLFLIQLLTGIGLGVFSSLLAIRKYLRI